jgi:hypothetical protein
VRGRRIPGTAVVTLRSASDTVGSRRLDPSGSNQIATRRPARPASQQPFVTRRSTLLFCAVFVVSSVLYQLLISADATGTGALGLVAAGAGAAAFVTGVVAWVAAVVIALRSGSLLWLLVAVLPIVPINALVCAMFCPAGPADKRP